MGEHQIQSLRRRLARVDGRGRRGYRAELRAEVVAAARQWRLDGRSQRELARRLGLSVNTLAAWARSAGKAVPRVRAVDVIEPEAERPADNLVAVLPCGLRIEGLTTEAAAELVRRLR